MKKHVLFISAMTISWSIYAQNIGIGTSDPDRPLTIKANTNQEILSFKNTADESKWFWTIPSGTDLRLSRTAAGDNTLWIKSDGKIGIGTANPLTSFHVNGTILANTGSFTNLWVGSIVPDYPASIKSNNENKLLVFSNANGISKWHFKLLPYMDDPNETDIFNLSIGNTIQPVLELDYLSGYVGVGVHNPTQKLDVNGNINLSGTIINMNMAALTLENGWVNYGEGFAPAAYHKDKQGIVRLTGLVRYGTLAEITDELPAGYRPQHELLFTVVSGNGFARVDVYPDGTLNLVGSYDNAYVSLDGISYKAAN